ncbi:uncharacterized protein MONBRDRAFT_7863 [Monosiga brevicollis MX1]|uniref:Mitochondrial carrier protein n=1 Tax=Monosiga brevicollis TaxID=81824 RepID=A9UXN1_MONBE|nr:uncharacterized protein MONBRDRAFT_7863 [Monosiga brevicollis MX1]EDQ89869.1 predicted protein [Monosiga brevicollis MX1]|eukprot:XP_001745291.1 hypothetical protein [Monosiga brevicollis MX1]
MTSAGQDLVLGVAAGAAEVCLMQPTLYLKNASQQGLPFTMDPRYLYRGLGASVLDMAVLTGLQFPLTKIMSSIVTGGASRKLTGSEMVASGFLGGLVSGVVCTPMELVMIQQQRFGQSLLTTPVTIVQRYGLGGLMRGLAPSCLREGIFVAGYLGLGPALSRHFEDTGHTRNQAKIYSAVIAGVVSATLSHPIDTVKTCMQGDIEQKRYGSVMQTTQTVAGDGVKAFFRGWNWRAGRNICSVFIINEVKDVLAPLLFGHQEDED